jgi:phosphohistidine phosphatase
MDLILLRHGEAGNRTSIPSKDNERSLTTSGRKEIEEIAAVLKKIEPDLDHIATSPLKRAEETALPVAKEFKIKIEKWDELKPEGKREELYQKLSKLKRDHRVLLVGHEPYLSALLSDLISGDTSSRVSLKKGGVARVRVDRFTPRPSGELRWLLTPRQLKRMS